MANIGAGEFLVLALAALFIFGPDRLPTIAKQAGRWIRDLRLMVANARRDLKDQAGVDLGDLQLSDLNPRTFVRRHLLEDSDLNLGDLNLGDLNPLAGPNGRPKSATGTAATTAKTRQRAAGESPRYDPDAT